MAKEFLSQLGFAFEEVDIVENPEAIEEMVARTGGVMATPTIVVGGKVIVGFNRRKLEEILSK